MAGSSVVVRAGREIAETGSREVTRLFSRYAGRGGGEILEAELVGTSSSTTARSISRAAGVTATAREAGGLTRGLKNLIRNNPKTFAVMAGLTGLAVESLQWKEAAKLLGDLVDKLGAKKALSTLTDDSKIGDISSYRLSCLIAKILLLPKDLSIFLLRSLNEDKFLYFSNDDLTQFGVPVSTNGFDIFKALDTMKLALSEHFEKYVTHGKFLLDNDLMTVVAAGSNDKNFVVKMAFSNEAIPLIVEQMLSDTYPDQAVVHDIKDNIIMAVTKLLEDYRLTGNVKKNMVAMELSQYL